MLIKDWGEDCAYSKNFVNWSAILYSQFTTVNKKFYQHANWFNTVSSRSKYFKNIFIPNAANESNKLDLGIRSSTSHKLFCNILHKFIWPAQRKTFNINDSVLKKLLTMLRLGFKHLREHKFRHRFRHILIPLCHCDNKRCNYNLLISPLPFL